MGPAAALQAGLLALALMAPAATLSALFGDPEAAARADYCETRSDDADTAAAVETALAPGKGAAQREQAAALLIQAGLRIAAQADSPADCRRRFEGGELLFERTLERNLKSLRGVARGARSKDASIRRVQEQVTEQWVIDQASRRAYLDLRTEDRSGAAHWAQRRATAKAVVVDARSTELMRELLAAHGWIDAHRFGGQASSRAWLLVQHADADPAFQAHALERMAAHLDTGGVRRRDYAYLWDRVAVNTGRLQRFGTQPIDACKPDGTLELKPVEDPDGLDARRATMGLGPAAADLARMSAERCGRAMNGA